MKPIGRPKSQNPKKNIVGLRFTDGELLFLMKEMKREGVCKVSKYIRKKILKQQ